MVDYVQYRRYIDKLEIHAKNNGLTKRELHEIYSRYYCKIIKNKSKNYFKIILNTVYWIFMIFFVLIVSSFGLYVHPYSHNLFLRNMQHCIYPVLNIFRKIAVPIITAYPELTELYDESCLFYNPYFKVSEMDCWPCANVHFIRNMSERNITKNDAIPFTTFNNNNKVNLSIIIDILNNEEFKKIFLEDASRIFSTNSSYSSIADLMSKNFELNPSDQLDTHISWRINRMRPSRILRKLFSPPEGLFNSWGISTERFLLFDEPRASMYKLPNPECSNIILKCTSGSRVIKLIPSSECLQNCKTLSIVLSAGYSLWYNWWYWRPVSFPTPNSTENTITYLTSFC